MSTKPLNRNAGNRLPKAPQNVIVTPPAAVAIGTPAPETAPVLETAPPVEEKESDEGKSLLDNSGPTPGVLGNAGDETDGEKKERRGRPPGQLNSFTAKIGALLAVCPELKAMFHCLSQKRKRDGAEIQALIASAIAAGGVAILTNPDFLASLPEEEIGDNLPLSREPRPATDTAPEVLPGMIQKYGADFDITLSRGGIAKYYSARQDATIHKLQKLVAPEAPAAPGEVKPDAASAAMGAAQDDKEEAAGISARMAETK